MATLKELADIVQGTVVGDPTLKIKGVSTIQNGKPESITFIAHPKYFEFVQSTEASAVITSDIEKLKNKDGIIVENPQMAMAKVLGHFSPKFSQIHLNSPKFIQNSPKFTQISPKFS